MLERMSRSEPHEVTFEMAKHAGLKAGNTFRASSAAYGTGPSRFQALQQLAAQTIEAAV
jgi:hypothetical protein